MNAITNLDADLPLVSEPDAPLTGLALYRDRRERAAALWADVPGEQFSLRNWRRSGDCGTICCALGWLAEKGIDGWRLGYQYMPCWGKFRSFKAAEFYFGLQCGDSTYLFSTHGDPYALGRHATGRDVGKALLAAPYVLPEDAP